MSPDKAKQMHLDAQRLFQEKKFDEALKLLDALDKTYPKNKNILFARAKCLVALGQMDEARTVAIVLKDELGHERGAELLAQIDAHMTAATPSFDIPDLDIDRPTSTPRPTPVRVQQTGSRKGLVVGAAVAALALIAAGAYFLNNGKSDESRVAEALRLPPPENPTYAKDVAPILNQNCVVCHRPGEAVPMSLMTFDEVRPWAKSVKNMVETRQMPPWHADASVGTWKNDRRMSDRDITTISRWVDQRAPRGNPKDEPKPIKITEGWKMGEPDMVFTMPVDQVLPANLEDEYRYVMIPTGFTKDRWIKAAEVRPGNYDVVHHVIVFTADISGQSEGLGGSLGGYAPGSQPLIMGKGQGMKVDAGTILVLQMHYHKEPGEMAFDNTSIGIKFADKTVKKELRFGTLGTQKFVIPAGRPDYPVEATYKIKEDIHIEQLIPHMHLRGKDMSVSALLPDGTFKYLLSVPEYDFNWQTFYELEKPLALPKGTELRAVAHFDNSTGNPFNPDATVDVRWGEPTTAEMMYSFFMYTVDDEKLKAKDPGA